MPEGGFLINKIIATMKDRSPNLTILIILSTLLLLASTPESYRFRTESVDTYSYTIEPESTITLDGTSNVVDFTCECTSSLGSGQFSMLPQGTGFSFTNSAMEVPVKALDCGNRTMNRDMYEALKSDQYPILTVRLLNVKSVADEAFAQCDEWEHFQVTMRLTIAGVSRNVQMQIKGAHLGYNLYRFTGSQPIYMTDYCIDPPRALLGTIRVDNCITIKMDLQLRLSPA